MLTRGDDRARRAFLWQQIAQSEQAWLRRNAERSLLQLQALDQIDQLAAAVVARLPPAAGERTPGTARRAAACCPACRVDPTGHAVRARSRDRTRARGSDRSPLFPMPDGARARSSELDALARSPSSRFSAWRSEAS